MNLTKTLSNIWENIKSGVANIVDPLTADSVRIDVKVKGTKLRMKAKFGEDGNLTPTSYGTMIELVHEIGDIAKSARSETEETEKEEPAEPKVEKVEIKDADV